MFRDGSKHIWSLFFPVASYFMPRTIRLLWMMSHKLVKSCDHGAKAFLCNLHSRICPANFAEQCAWHFVCCMLTVNGCPGPNLLPYTCHLFCFGFTLLILKFGARDEMHLVCIPCGMSHVSAVAAIVVRQGEEVCCRFCPSQPKMTRRPRCGWVSSGRVACHFCRAPAATARRTSTSAPGWQGFSARVSASMMVAYTCQAAFKRRSPGSWHVRSRTCGVVVPQHLAGPSSCSHMRREHKRRRSNTCNCCFCHGDSIVSREAGDGTGKVRPRV